jgi:hypothetical protein
MKSGLALDGNTKYRDNTTFQSFLPNVSRESGRAIEEIKMGNLLL